MECTNCHNKLELIEFSLKNKKEKIYYLHCNLCREKVKKQRETYKEVAKEKYEILKETNKIYCDCGVIYTGFRIYHIYRHKYTKRHQQYENDLINNNI